MSSPAPAPRPPGSAVVALALAPSGLALAWLLAGLRWPALFHAGDPLGALLPVLALVVCLALARRVRARADGWRARLPAALLGACFLAPLTVIAPWTIAPSHFGVGTGALPFFLAWLTRYPDWHGVNHEVLLGILCVLGAAAMPVVFALAFLRARRRRRAWLVGLGVLGLVPWVPVAVRLDSGLCGYALVVLRHGPVSLFMPQGGGSLTFRASVALMTCAGALGRLAAVVAVVALTVRALRRGTER